MFIDINSLFSSFSLPLGLFIFASSCHSSRIIGRDRMMVDTTVTWCASNYDLVSYVDVMCSVVDIDRQPG